MESRGSTLFSLTWKVLATPAGRPFCLLRASVRRTGGTGSSSTPVPTPNAMSNRGGLQNNPQDALRRRERGHMLNLDDVAMMAALPTPTRADGERASLNYFRGNETLAGAAALSTPASRDWKDTPGMATEAENPDGSHRTRLDHLPRQVLLAASGPTPAGGSESTGSPGRLNPAYSRWLMGFPASWERGLPGYTDWTLWQRVLSGDPSALREAIDAARLRVGETRSSRKLRRSSSGRA